jgi:hypothetical protein
MPYIKAVNSYYSVKSKADRSEDCAQAYDESWALGCQHGSAGLPDGIF